MSAYSALKIPSKVDKKATTPAAKNAAAKSAGVGHNVASHELNMKMYRDMLLIRRFEEKAGQLYGMKLIGGFCHLYIGQEAVVVGLQSTITPDDAVITTYRDHGHMLACGMTSRGVMAELTGRIGGYSKGKGGSMHMFSREKNFFGGHGIVGANVPLGTGIALAMQYRGTKNLCMTYFGDGASNQGQVYEAFNMAALWKLPVIYVIENNQYAMGTSIARACAGPGLFHRGEPYGIPGERVDGMDVLAVRAAGLKAVEHVRSGKGPYLLEMMTYRYRGHSMSDPQRYRTSDEVSKWRDSKDPIERLRGMLLEQKVAKDNDFEAIEAEIKAIVNDAAEFAQTSPEPGAEELFTDVLL